MRLTTDPNRAARDGEEVHWRDDRGQDIVSSWHRPASPAPDGRPHGSAAICFTAEGNVVLVTWPGVSWEFPGGRPLRDEDWRATLEREVLEEACASVEEATLLGFVKMVCVRGPNKGVALVRSIWRARVLLNSWEPRHETTGRLIVPPDEALERAELGRKFRPIYLRWMREALAAERAARGASPDRTR